MFQPTQQERWRDEFVSWDPNLYEGLSYFTVPSSRLWSPDISIKEAIGVSQQHSEVYVRVEPSGWVSRVEDMLLTLHCDLAMLLFPFDQQKCNITFYPQLHTEHDVVLNIDTRHAFYNRTHGEWDLKEIKLFSYSEQQYSHLCFQVELERYSLFYVLNLMVPSALVMLVDVAAFALPADCAERIPFKVTLLFSYTVFLLLVTDIRPPFRDSTPMLGLKRSFALGCGRAGPGACGQECLTDRLRDELDDVSEELRMLNWSYAQRSSRLRLMEAVDQFCFRVYTFCLAVFVLSLTLLWTLGR
ncbi:hypothetical protein P4O66_021640 [Electrophorus voltai]|uniref:Neurotransmitter-gated ion-channel ligand-binding domain-containing protein n=1 Tax=Electrophorus voltai TaxID=2609070 RepID=A0AAD8ZPW7_9TELE|nr:hypothetical protein P4O66_021640 [Electrophorus voltai]